MELRVEHVRPVLRPLLATCSFAERTLAGTASVLDGGAAAMLVEPAAPRSRMLPVVSTAPGVMAAMAASTLLGAGPVQGLDEQGLGFSAAAWVRVATVVVGPTQVGLVSTKPGCVMACPAVP